MNDSERWSIINSRGRPVIKEVPLDVTNYDRRLLALSWELAAEIIMMRKSIEKN